MRSLLYAAPPSWACEERAATDILHPDRRRLGSMVAVLAAAPRAAADAVFGHMFTDNVDVSQRLLALEVFGGAAAELAGEPSVQPLLPPGAAARCAHPSERKENIA